MIYRHQLFSHDPKNEIYGDCHRTALACILDLEPVDVPHFMFGLGPDDGTIFEQRQRDFLATLNLVPIVVPYPGDQGLEIILQSINSSSPGVYYLLGGESERGFGHTVVAYGDKIIHDPHPSNCGITGPMSDGFYWITFIGKLFERP